MQTKNITAIRLCSAVNISVTWKFYLRDDIDEQKCFFPRYGGENNKSVREQPRET